MPTNLEIRVAHSAIRFKARGVLHPKWSQLFSFSRYPDSVRIARILRSVRNYLEDQFGLYCVLVGESYYKEKAWRKKGHLPYEEARRHKARRGNSAVGIYFPNQTDEHLLVIGCVDYSNRSRTYDMRARRKTRIAQATNLLSHEAIVKNRLLNGS